MWNNISRKFVPGYFIPACNTKLYKEPVIIGVYQFEEDFGLDIGVELLKVNYKTLCFYRSSAVIWDR